MIRNLVLCSTLLAGTCLAQTATTPPPACDTASHRQFDFWLGDWRVVGGPDGKTPVGSSRITRVASGCALLEHWTSAQGGEGQSLNVYEASGDHWTQFWIGADGVVLRLQGGLREGAMVMEGRLPKAGGGEQHQRITWTPAADGSVSQHWQTSDDEGATWATSFLGIYRRVPPAEAGAGTP